MPNYKIGTDDPPLSHDVGAGTWFSKPPERLMRLKKDTIMYQLLPTGLVLTGPDAFRHLVHYFENTGADLQIRLRNMVAEVPSAQKLYDQELKEAKAFVSTLSAGSYNITSGSTSGGYNHEAENKNWYFAIGGYTAWGKAEARVFARGQNREYALDFEYHFYDRYNWDTGKKVTIPVLGYKVTDKEMGEFHRQGLAKEYDCFGSMRDSYSWTDTSP